MTTVLVLVAVAIGFMLFWVVAGMSLVIVHVLYVSWKWAREARKRGYPPCIHETMTASQLEKLAALRRSREESR